MVDNHPSPQGPQVSAIFCAVDISLSEVATGKIEKLIVSREDDCEACLGTGQSWRDDNGTCSRCNNLGFIKNEKTLSVRIPAGIENGTKMRITGEGHLRVGEEARGEVYVAINVTPHELFTRQGKNLHALFKLTSQQLKDGCELMLATLLDSEKKLRIPSGTNDGTVFRLAGLGLCALADPARGDIFVKVTTEVPKNVRNTAAQPSNTPPAPSIDKSNALRELFRKHPKKIAAVVLALVSCIYISSRPSGKEPPANVSANTSSPLATKPVTLNQEPPMRAPVLVNLNFSLPNGKNITSPQGPRGPITMKIVNRAAGDMALKIVSDSSQTTNRFVYVRSGETVVISHLARDVYLLRWETGVGWDVNNRRFLTMRAHHQFDQTFDARRTNWTIHFTPSPEGHLRELPLSTNDFEDK